jgi:hypothetical protein
MAGLLESDVNAMSTSGCGDDQVSSPMTFESITTAGTAATDDPSTNSRSLFDCDDEEDEAESGSTTTTHGTRTSDRKRQRGAFRGHMDVSGIQVIL